MKRLIIVCEGPTEQEFCTEVLGAELVKHNIYVETPIIKHSHGGIVHWTTIKKQIMNHLQEGDAHVSMLVDYYGIKDQFAFPGWEEAKSIADKKERIHFLMEKMAEDIPETYRFRFIPYIQLHEFEGLLFSDVSAFLKSFDESELNYEELRTTAEAYDTPEMINNSPDTAPSKRLLAAIPGYNKVVVGNCIAMDIGLDKMREKCPLFNEWVERLLR